MSDTLRYINPGNETGTVDGLLPSTGYTSLELGISTEAQTVALGDTFTFECLTENSTVDEVAVASFNLWSILGDLYIKAYTGHEAVATGIDVTKYSISNDTLDTITVDTDNVHIENLQISHGAALACVNFTSGDNLSLLECYFFLALTGNAVNQDSLSSTCTITKCIAKANNPSSSSEGFYAKEGASLIITKSIAYGFNDGIEDDALITAVTDSAVFYNTTDFDGVASADNCASDDGYGTNPVSALNSDWDEEFTDSANGEFTQILTGNVYGAGIYTLGTTEPSSTFNTTYDGNGSTGGTVPTDSTDYEEDDAVTVLDNTGTLTRTGYTFNGWNTQADGLGTPYAVGGTFTISADTILYAVWVGVDRTLTYNGNGSDGGTVPVDGSSPYANGDTVTVFDNTGTLTLTGYVFNGWNTASDGTGTPYVSGDTFDISADTILYAVWVLTYTLIYNGNGFDGGTVPVDGSSPYASGSDATILGNTGSLTLSGYIFVAWNTATDGTGTNYEASDILSGISADTILYVLWKTEAELIDSYLNPVSSGGYLLEAEYYGG